ncbi:hypothetical protein D3C87_1964250 [compost metagenome]
MLWQIANGLGVPLHEVKEFDCKAVQQPALSVDRVDAPMLQAWGNPLKLVETLETMSCNSLVEVTTSEKRLGGGIS